MIFSQNPSLISLLHFPILSLSCSSARTLAPKSASAIRHLPPCCAPKSTKSEYMEDGSSSSSRNRRVRVGSPPLITCPDCNCRQVVELRSQKPWSKGEIFYTCPNHRSDGTGCRFWHWKNGYIAYLEDEERKKQLEGDKCMDYELMPSMAERHGAERSGDAAAVIDIGRALVALGKDITWLLKCIVVLGLVSVVVLVLLLLVTMVK